MSTSSNEDETITQNLGDNYTEVHNHPFTAKTVVMYMLSVLGAVLLTALVVSLMMSKGSDTPTPKLPEVVKPDGGDAKGKLEFEVLFYDKDGNPITLQQK